MGIDATDSQSNKIFLFHKNKYGARYTREFKTQRPKYFGGKSGDREVYLNLQPRIITRTVKVFNIDIFTPLSTRSLHEVNDR